ncbi:MAG: hypothetical protein V1668_04160 [Patescibacteria group bacterium]
MKKQLLVTLVIAIIVTAGAFFGGMTFQKSRDSLSGLTGQELTAKMNSLGLSSGGFGGGLVVNGMGTSPNGNFPGGTSGSRQFGGGGMISGEIVSMDSQSITVKQQDNSTKVVYYSSSTAITKSATATAGDLTVGVTVRATGTANTDNSITAQILQVNPAETVTPPAIPDSTNAAVQ